MMHTAPVFPLEPVLKSVRCLHEQTSYNLAYWQWGEPDAEHVLVCAHGLLRQGRDFDVLAQTLLRDVAAYGLPSLRIICLDMPGRGRSDWFSQAQWYQVAVYVQAMVQMLAHLEQQTRIGRLDWLGTSMGGLIGLGLAPVQEKPAWPLSVRLSCLVLNDVGPTISKTAISRIASYIGNTDHFASEKEAMHTVQHRMHSCGPHTPEQWQALTRWQLRPHSAGGYQWHYDRAIGEAIRQSTPMQWKLAEMALWRIYDHLTMPVFLLRGANSDLLTRATAAAMQKRGPRAHFVEFAGVGHAPTLVPSEQSHAVSEFLFGKSGV